MATRYPMIQRKRPKRGKNAAKFKRPIRRLSASARARLNRAESAMFLVAGIGHDFNSMLTGVLAGLEGARSGLERVRAKAITDTEHAVWRARGLANELMTFTLDQPSQRQSLDLVTLARGAVNFALSGGRVRCEERVGDNIWQGAGDRNQISRVIHNLVINARQAMPEGGTLRMDIVNVLLGPGVAPSAPLRGRPPSLRSGDGEWNGRSAFTPRAEGSWGPGVVPKLPKGKYIRITLQDEGPGIPVEHVDRIFDPFFTTKNGGSGLGLAVAASIVKAHGGAITVASGSGAVFSVYLPAA